MIEGGSSRRLLVALVYRERSPGYTHAAIEVPGPVLHSGNLQAGQWFDFAIALPPDALPGQRLPHGEVYWEVTARCDKAGFDAHASARLDDAAAAAEAAREPSEPVATDGSGLPLVDPGWVQRQRNT